MHEVPERNDPHAQDIEHSHGDALTLGEGLERAGALLGLYRVRSLRVRRGLEGLFLGDVLGLVFAVIFKMIGPGPGHQVVPDAWGDVFLIALGFAVLGGICAVRDWRNVR